MRVISGRLKGKKLFAPKGLTLRPTSDRVKEAIFDLLQKFPAGERVLDLFAGTGALGIETLSRGAQRAVFVEENSRSGDVLRRNIEACHLEDQAEVLIREVAAGLKVLEQRQGIFDLIFLDPPYGKGLAHRTLRELGSGPLLSPATLIVAEHSPKEDLVSIPSLERIDWRKYGGTEVSFFRLKDKDPNGTQINTDEHRSKKSKNDS